MVYLFIILKYIFKLTNTIDRIIMYLVILKKQFLIFIVNTQFSLGRAAKYFMNQTIHFFSLSSNRIFPSLSPLEGLLSHLSLLHSISDLLTSAVDSSSSESSSLSPSSSSEESGPWPTHSRTWSGYNSLTSLVSSGGRSAFSPTKQQQSSLIWLHRTIPIVVRFHTIQPNIQFWNTNVSPAQAILITEHTHTHKSGWIFEKVIDSYKPSVRVPPSPPPLFPNFPVPSSYKNGNCLNIRTSLDILDSIHPRK